MAEVGIHTLRQNASAVVDRVAAGETVTITRHGRPVAKMVPLRISRLVEMIEAGEARPAGEPASELQMPDAGPSLAGLIIENRDAERF